MNETVKRVQALLYLLMRDSLPMSDVAQAVSDATVIAFHNETDYEAKGLAAQAEEFAERLLNKFRAAPEVEPWHRNSNGMTIAELRKWLEDKPDNGEVWLTNYDDGLTNVCVEMAPLNAGEDVLLSPRVKERKAPASYPTQPCQHKWDTSSYTGQPVKVCLSCGEIEPPPHQLRGQNKIGAVLDDANFANRPDPSEEEEDG